MNLEGIQAITFDAAGTLIAPYPSVGEVYAEVLGDLGFLIPPEQLETNFRAAFKAVKKAKPDGVLDLDRWRDIVALTLHGLTPAESFDTQFDALWNAFAESRRWRVLPEVAATLAALKARGFRLFVLSNNDARLRGILEGLCLADYFEAIFISAEIGAEKPSPQIFSYVQSQIGVKPAAILHIGDTPKEDIEGAKNAGWQSALVGAKSVPSAIESASGLSSLFDL